jgi:hypothetical protein
VKLSFVPATAICLGLLAWSGQAAAQADQSPAAQALGGDSGPGNVAPPGGSSGFGHRGNHGHQSSDSASQPGEMPELKPVVEPRQRLDAGALLCQTEAELKQHQAAIMARLAGRTAPEPSGCHIVGETIAVAVVTHDGQAVTQVQMAGDTPMTGWTDAVIRDADPLHSATR